MPKKKEKAAKCHKCPQTKDLFWMKPKHGSLKPTVSWCRECADNDEKYYDPYEMAFRRQSSLKELEEKNGVTWEKGKGKNANRLQKVSVRLAE